MATPKQKERYQRMIQAALSEFCRKGFQEVSVDVIAKRATVSKATLYNHFPNKEALFMAVFDYSLDQLDRKFQETSFSKISDPFERAKASIQSFMQDIVENPEYGFFSMPFLKM